MSSSSVDHLSSKILLVPFLLFITVSATNILPTDSVNNDTTSSLPPKQSASLSATELLWKKQRILKAHAILSILSLTLFVPLAALILRFNIQKPHLLGLHIVTQIFALAIYAAGAGLGVWLAVVGRKYGLFSDPHGYIGLIVLGGLLIQPIFGWVHHLTFMKRCMDVQEGRGEGKLPGRTGWSWVHVWSGRVLIVIGVVNGGFGFRLTGKSNAIQSFRTTRRMEILYSVLVGTVMVIYTIVVLRFEIMRLREKEPTEEQIASGKRRVSEFGSVQKVEGAGEAREDEIEIVTKEQNGEQDLEH